MAKNKGGRPRKLQLKFDEESINRLLQECYRDSHTHKSVINGLFTKWVKEAQEGPEIAAIGDSIVKTIQLQLKNQDQKLLILKYLKDVVFNEKAGDNSSSNNSIEDEARNAIIELATKEMDEKKKSKEK